MFISGIYQPHNQNRNDLQQLFYKFSEIFGDLKINLHEIGDGGEQVGYQI